MAKIIDRTGMRYGRLLVCERVLNAKPGPRWLCRCDCGGATAASASNLVSGHVASCGCIQRENAAALGASKRGVLLRSRISIAEMVELRRAGLTLREIGALAGISGTAVHVHLRQAGAPPPSLKRGLRQRARSPKHPSHEVWWPEAASRRAQGETLAAIGKTYGVTRQAVAHALRTLTTLVGRSPGDRS